MSWLKLTLQVRGKKHKQAEEENERQQNFEKQKKQELLEKLERLSSQAIPLLDSWKHLDCDRILNDVQRHVLDGEVSLLEIRFSNNVKAANVYESPKGWVFGNRKTEGGRLSEVLFQEGYNPDKFISFNVSRHLFKKRYVTNEKYIDEVFDEIIEAIFTLTIDSENIYCDGNILGSLDNIKNSQMLENRIDEILAHRIDS